MIMIIMHIDYIICLVTNDDWHAYDVIGVYKIHLRADLIFRGTGNSAVPWYGYGRGQGPLTFKEASQNCGWRGMCCER